MSNELLIFTAIIAAIVAALIISSIAMVAKIFKNFGPVYKCSECGKILNGKPLWVISTGALLCEKCYERRSK